MIYIDSQNKLTAEKGQQDENEMDVDELGSAYQERRNGSLRLLKTLTTRLSLVTASICGPGNWPLIRIPCKPHPFSIFSEHGNGSLAALQPLH
jgi:hypothetical protein